MENSKLKLLIALFLNHPGVDTFHLTTDDQAFFEDHRATAHAESLKEKKVEKFERKDIEALAKSEKPAAKAKVETTGDQGSGAGDQTGTGGDKPKSEKELLQAEYLQVLGAKPNHLLGVSKLKAAIEAKKAEGANQE